jgi:Peptidase family M28/PDZ domain/PA domain
MFRDRVRLTAPRGGALAALVALAVTWGPAAAQAPAAPAEPAADRAPLKAMVSADSIMAYGSWLADDAREGRMTGSPGADASAAFIAAHFKAWGLEGGGDGDSYLQHFPALMGVGYGEGNALAITGVKDLGPLALDRDFRPLAVSDNGTAQGGIVFAGYGITAPDLGYDDYAGIDVTGKIVLVLRDEPQQNDSTSVFDGTINTPHATLDKKATNAAAHGAAALLVFTGPDNPGYAEDALVKPKWLETAGGGGLPALHVKAAVGEALLASRGIDVREWVRSVDRDLKPHSVGLGPDVTASLTVAIETEKRQAENVVAMLPGKDPHAGVIVVGAHYDHLGRGGESSLAPNEIGQIHNGADDNASGTSCLIEVARVLSKTGPYRRPILFTAFSGEEEGMLGSRYLVEEDPPIPVDFMKAMLNMDMVGRPKNMKLIVGGVGTSPVFAPILDREGAGSPLTVVQQKGAFSPSDHHKFYLKKIPVLFFFSGLHEDYHKPSDDWDKIDREGITAAARLVASVTADLADLQEDLAFVRADDDSGGQGASTVRGHGAWFGSIPDYGAEVQGVRLSGVMPDSPAEKAGIREGDVVIEFGGREVKNIYHYTDAINAHKPGDTVEVVVLRDGQEVHVQVTLARRGG